MNVNLEKIRNRLVTAEEKRFEEKKEAYLKNHLSYIYGIRDALEAVDKEMKNNE